MSEGVRLEEVSICRFAEVRYKCFSHIFLIKKTIGGLLR